MCPVRLLNSDETQNLSVSSTIHIGLICHCREYMSTALESSSNMLDSTASDALHCAWWCKTWMQLLGPEKPIPRSSLDTLLEEISRPHEVWGSVANDYAGSRPLLYTRNLSIHWLVDLWFYMACFCHSQPLNVFCFLSVELLEFVFPLRVTAVG